MEYGEGGDLKKRQKKINYLKKIYRLVYRNI